MNPSDGIKLKIDLEAWGEYFLQVWKNPADYLRAETGFRTCKVKLNDDIFDL